MPLTELKAVGGIFILYDSCLWRPAGRSKHFFTRKALSKKCILTVNAMDHRGPLVKSEARRICGFSGLLS